MSGARAVARDRAAQGSSPSHRIRAAASLTAFTNALAVSLFALVYGTSSGTPPLVLSVAGLLFVIASILSLRREPRAARDVLFLATLLAALVAQLVAAIRVVHHPISLSDQRQVASLVIVFFLIGIARAWELIDGPSIGIRTELFDVARELKHANTTHDPSDEAR
ncbi:MAG TPA: hypothetical protein VGI55_12155 [Solirubrobacteraceae bacterium]